MRYLLDTCCISELRKKRPHPEVVAFVRESDPEALFLSVISIGEIRKGVEDLPIIDPRRRQLLQWLEGIKRLYANRILPISTEVAESWGELTSGCAKAGTVLAVSDGLIAASALDRGMHIVTRNTKGFEPTGVPVLNFWDRKN